MKTKISETAATQITTFMVNEIANKQSEKRMDAIGDIDRLIKKLSDVRTRLMNDDIAGLQTFDIARVAARIENDLTALVTLETVRSEMKLNVRAAMFMTEFTEGENA